MTGGSGHQPAQLCLAPEQWRGACLSLQMCCELSWTAWMEGEPGSAGEGLYWEGYICDSTGTSLTG